MKMSLLFILILATGSQVLGQAEPPTDSTFVVPKNETIPVDELSLLLTPLTRDDLAKEVDLWQVLLQEKLLAISEVQITMKYLNRDLNVFEEVQSRIAEFLMKRS